MPPEDLIQKAMAARGMEAPATDNQPPQQGQPAPQPQPEQGGQQSVDKEAAQDAGDPKTEGDQTQEAPVVYKFRRQNGDQDEEIELSESQILGTLDRYKSLNSRQARLKPVISLAEKIMDQVGDKDPKAADKLAGALAQGLKQHVQGANTRTDMGQTKSKGDGRAAPDSGADADDFDWDAWAEQNAIDLPPQLKGGKFFNETQQKIDGLTKAVTQLATLMKAQAQGNAQGQQNAMQQIQGAAQETANQKRDVEAERIKANLSKAQQEFQMPDEAGQEFLDFAMRRGFTVADFADYDLLKDVVSDFSRARQEPDFQRAQEQMKRRQAYTGSLDTAPTAGGHEGNPQPSNKDAFINRMVESKRR